MSAKKALLAFTAVCAAASLTSAAELPSRASTLGRSPDLRSPGAATAPVGRPTPISVPDDAPRRGLRLVWDDPAGAAGRWGDGARAETARLFKAMGIPATWRESSAGEALNDEEIAVILLDRDARADRSGLILGATPEHFAGAPFVWVHVPSVREVLGMGGRDPWSLELPDGYALGIALGRVIAHEIVHAVTPATPHGHGLMASRLTRRDLTAATLEVPPDVTATVRSILARGLDAQGADARR